MRATPRVHYVPVDFLRDDSFALLAQAAWQREQPTLFVWEDVTNYLREEASRPAPHRAGLAPSGVCCGVSCWSDLA